MQMYFVPSQFHFISIFISEAIRKGLVMGYCEHVTECRPTKCGLCLQGPCSHIGED